MTRVLVGSAAAVVVEQKHLASAREALALYETVILEPGPVG
jgi:hypothetical protein